MNALIKNKLIGLWVFAKQLVFLIGLLALIAFVKLNITGSVQINTDIFRDSSEIREIENKLKDLEILETNNLPEKIRGGK